MFAPLRAVVALCSCLLLVACSGVAGPTGVPVQPPQHGGWTPPPVRIPPVATSAPWPGQSWAAPTSAPYPGTNFQDSGVNPFVDPARDPYSTFAMDVDTASYSVARSYLADGNMPDADSVRVEEFVNAFDYNYPAPSNDTFAISIDGGPSPFVGQRALELRIGIQARVIPSDARPPVSLTFVIDTSGSMGIDNRLELVKAALDLLVSRLQPNDSVAIVRFGSDAAIVLQPTSVAEPQVIEAAIARLSPGGSTNAQAGLELGYDLAAAARRPGATDRVVLASDGVANVGLTDADSILARIDREVDQGVELVSIGVGLGNFNDVLLEQLADRGNGFYAYINDRSDAERVFGAQLTGTLVTVAQDARVQVDFDPAAVSRYRLLGYENRQMADSDFNNPAADAGEVGAGHSVTALYEIEPAWERTPTLGTVSLHWIDPDTGARRELTRAINLGDFSADYRSTSAGFHLATTVAGLAELLRDSPYATDFDLADVAAQAESLPAYFPGNRDVADFATVAAEAARLGQNDSASSWGW
jgi:Ca-activated chloride channel family protein